VSSESSNPSLSTEIQALASALRLLETVAEHEGEGMSELARNAQMTHNQTHRILATLETHGYVIRNDARGYHIGPKLAVLERRAGRYRNLIEAASAGMDDLAAQTGESILLAVRNRLERMVIDSRPSRHSLRVDWPVGSRLPLHVGGLGVALLAFAPQAVQLEVMTQPRNRFTAQTLTDKKALQSELEQVRKSKVRISKDDYANGEFSVAAPIIDATGEAIAAINIAGFTARLTPKLERDYSRLVREVAEEIASSLR
jgi:DNA-binding IclR family transcriptional regulator